MNPDQVKQIVETIKTLNLNIDSQSGVEISKVVTKYLLLVQVKEFTISVLSIAGFVLAIFFITKAVRSYYDKKESNNA